MIPVPRLREIAEQVHATRPGWDTAGILTMLARQDVQSMGDEQQLLAAALRAAANPDAKSPAAIGWPSSWITAPPRSAAEPPRYEPLPECSACGQPVSRGAAPDTCPGCGALWAPGVAADDCIGAAAGGLDGPQAVREALAKGLGQELLDGDERAARAVECPWCGVKPGMACVVRGSGRAILDQTRTVAMIVEGPDGRVPIVGHDGKPIRVPLKAADGPDRPLTDTPCHPARWSAAGLPGAPRIDPRAITARYSPKRAEITAPEPEPIERTA